MGEALTVPPFQNTLSTFELTGNTILAARENGASQVEEGAGRFPQVAGLEYSFDATAPAGARVSGVEVLVGGDAWPPEAWPSLFTPPAYPSPMCGRFTITHPDEAIARLFDATLGNDLPPVPRFNICPTTQVAVVTSDGGTRRLRAMRWGFLPHWYKTPTDGPLIINARADTIATKPAFREAVRTRRCIVPASGFYEWQEVEGKKLPWYFTRRDGDPMALAGIWQRWGDIDTVAIVSTDAGPGMFGLHHREAVVLEKPDWPLWLGEAGHGAAVLMKPLSDGVLQCHRVDPRVNSNRAEGPDLIAPIAA